MSSPVLLLLALHCFSTSVVSFGKTTPCIPFTRSKARFHISTSIMQQMQVLKGQKERSLGIYALASPWRNHYEQF
jgi:hypothetical protein